MQKVVQNLTNFWKGMTRALGGGASDHPAFYAGVVFGAAIQRICPTKERGGYIKIIPATDVNSEA